MKNGAIFKFNGGNGALLCSHCSVILKVGYEMTKDEKRAMRGEKYLKPQFCSDCQSKTLLWLDDCRSPFQDDWLVFSPITGPKRVIWVKSYNEFVSWIKDNYLPGAICFDHDLGLDVKQQLRAKGISKRKSRQMYNEMNEKNGFDCAKWLVEYCMDKDLPLPLYNIQSANSVGKENIDSLLKNFIKHTK